MNTLDIHWTSTLEIRCTECKNICTLKRVVSPSEPSVETGPDIGQYTTHMVHTTYNQHMISEYMNGKFAKHKQHKIIFLSWLQKTVELDMRIMT